MMDNGPTNINKLPDELLLKIFSYLSVEDLGLKIACVCVRWSHLGLADVLWKDSMFSADRNVPQDYILSVLDAVPKLQCFEMFEPTTEIFNKVAECCKNLRKLIVCNSYFNGGCEEALPNLVRECKSLEEVTLPGDALLNEEFAACLGQLTRLRAITLIGDSYIPITLKHLADGCPSLQHLDIAYVNWIYSDMKYFLEKKHKQLVCFKLSDASLEGSYVFPLLSMCQDSLHELHLRISLHDFDAYINGPLVNVIKTLPSLKSLKINAYDGPPVDVLATNGAMS